jgi:hypothetical protein
VPVNQARKPKNFALFAFLAVRSENWKINMKIFTIAPDFELPDFNGSPVKLSDFQGSKNLVLIFLRGFM